MRRKTLAELREAQDRLLIVACPHCGKAGQTNPHFNRGPDGPAYCQACDQWAPYGDWHEPLEVMTEC